MIKIAKIRIYTDGACSKNPGPGGWAAVLLFSNSKQEISGFEPDTTNNRMELKAIIEAIKLAQTLGYNKIDVYSDSSYCVNTVRNKWIKKWEYNGWKTIKGENVKNKDLWEKLSQLIKKHKGVNLIKVKGHSGNKHNERADLLARKEIERMRLNA